jgi:hypothetical protein
VAIARAISLSLAKHLQHRHANLVDVLHGPLALFALGDVPDDLTRTQLLATEQRGVDEWQMPTSTQGLKMVPYPAINKETYRLYLPVKT